MSPAAPCTTGFLLYACNRKARQALQQFPRPCLSCTVTPYSWCVYHNYDWYKNILWALWTGPSGEECTVLRLVVLTWRQLRSYRLSTKWVASYAGVNVTSHLPAVGTYMNRTLLYSGRVLWYMWGLWSFGLPKCTHSTHRGVVWLQTPWWKPHVTKWGSVGTLKPALLGLQIPQTGGGGGKCHAISCTPPHGGDGGVGMGVCGA